MSADATEAGSITVAPGPTAVFSPEAPETPATPQPPLQQPPPPPPKATETPPAHSLIFAVAETMQPFRNQELAADFLAKMAPDIQLRQFYEIIPFDHGFAIQYTGRRASKTVQILSPVGESTEKYYKVVFSAKSDPNQMDNVELSVNGETLVIQREHPVVIPERFVECARHARFPHMTQLPGQPRKIVGWVEVFPFSILSEGTKEQFIEQRRIGTEATRRKLEALTTVSTDLGGL